jgi:hypothetical protein
VHACECVLFLATLKDATMQKAPGIYAVSFPLLSLVLPVLRLYIFLCVVCARERETE